MMRLAAPRAWSLVVAGICAATVLGAVAQPARTGAASSLATATPSVELTASGRLLAPPLVVIGVGGLGWSDVSPERTPRLWQLLESGAAAGAVTVHTLDEPSCPAAGWLALSAGRGVVDPEPADACQRLPNIVESGTGNPGGATVAGWDRLATTEAASTYDAKIGMLGSALADAGICATAVGAGAALALADRAGEVARYRSVLTADAFDCPVTFVDMGPTSLVDASLRRKLPIDSQIGDVLDHVSDDATVLVTSVSTTIGSRLEMGVAIAIGPHVKADLLTTASTRWTGVVRLLDLPPSVLESLEVSLPQDFQGSPFVMAKARGDAVETARTLGRVTVVDRVLRDTSGPLTTGLNIVALLLLILLWLGPATWLGRGPLRGAALVIASIPASAYLVTLTHWWHFGSPLSAMLLGIAVIAVALAVTAAVINQRFGCHPVFTIAIVSVTVMASDAIVGSPLSRGSPFGPSPMLGGRFYGFGNVTYSLFAVYAIAVAASVAVWANARGRRRFALRGVAGIGAFAVAIDIWPTWGADIGGGLALIPAFVVLALGAAGLRITRGRALISFALAVVVVAGVSVLDWLRPADSRSHAGRFVQQVIDGDAMEIVQRKGGYALATLGAGPAAWITTAALVLGIAALARPARIAPGWLQEFLDRWALLRTSLAAIVVALALGALVNDYGIRIVTIGAIALIPLLVLLRQQRGAS